MSEYISCPRCESLATRLQYEEINEAGETVLGFKCNSCNHVFQVIQ